MPLDTLYVTGFSKESKAADLAPDFEKYVWENGWSFLLFSYLWKADWRQIRANDANGMYVGKLCLWMLLIGVIWICKNPILILLVLIETQLSFIFLFPDYSFPESIPELSSPEVSLFSWLFIPWFNLLFTVLHLLNILLAPPRIIIKNPTKRE